MAAAVSGIIGSFGRGRGRGRGMLANPLRQPGQPSIARKSSAPETRIIQLSDATQKSHSADVTNSTTSVQSHYADVTNTTTTSENPHIADVTNIMEKLRGKTEFEVMQDILPEIEALKSPQVIEDLVNALSEKALCDATFAVIAAKLAHKIWDNESMHSFIRNPLLKQTHNFYNKREKLRKENKYNGLCVYLCELFKYLHVDQKPLAAVGDAAVHLLKGLMENSENPSNEDVLIFYQELKNIGGLIIERFPEQLEEVINIARRMVISLSLEASVRCRLVHLIELHAAKWKIKDEMKMQYNDLLQDLKPPES